MAPISEVAKRESKKMIQSRWSKVLGILPLVGALAGFAGCNNPQDADDESTDVAASELAAPEAEAKGGKPEQARGGRHGRPGGPGFLLGIALHKLDLTEAQKATIQGQMDALQANDEAPEGAHAAGRKALAEAIRSGKIDEAAFSKPLAKEPADRTQLVKALSVLHDTLDAKQRQALVDAVKAKMEKHGDRDGKREGGENKRGDREGKRAEGGNRRGDREGKRGWDRGGDDGERGHDMRGPMGMLRGIELTDAQREGVREAFEKMAPSEAEREAMKAQHEAGRAAMRERLASFVSDRFDASAFVAMPEGAAKHGPDGMFGGMVKMLAKVVPILDETQRAELANRIEEGPAAHMGKAKGAHRKHAE